MIVADSPLLLALLAQSPFSSRAAALLEQGMALATPQAALTEALAGARELARLGHMSPQDARLAAEALPPLLAAIVPDTGLLPQGMELAAEFELPLTPALCLALARQRALPLATFDDEVAQVATRLGIADALAEA